jgi:three-Cys-motif partner protein
MFKSKAAIPDLVSRDDGLTIRDSGPWAKEKLYYVSRYTSIFNRGMKKLWSERAYIDLMAGPGRSVDRDTGEEFDGSPLLALKSEPPFKTLVFVEAEADYAAALTERTAAHEDRRTVLPSDCNNPATIAEIRRIVGANTLTLCFVDNLGLNVRFETITRLVEGNRPIDFVFTFQVNDFARNIDDAMTSAEGDRFDAFFGTPRWREVVRRFDRGQTARSDRATALADFYGEQLACIGYGQVEQLHRLMKNTRNAPLYRLLLASRNARATSFFRKIAAIEHDGQRGFRFDDW